MTILTRLAHGIGPAVIMCAAALLSGCGATLSETQSLAPESFASESAKAGAPVEAAAASPSPAAAVQSLLAAAPTSETAYRIGPSDMLEVTVFKVPELSKTVQVADNGSVNLPLLGEVPVSGQTAQDVERYLTKKLGGEYLQKPQVTVLVKEYNSQIVTLDGAVKKPGVYPLKGRMTLLQLVASAGGITEVAESEVLVFRGGSGTKNVAKFNIEHMQSGTAKDVPLQKDDVVIVNTSAAKVAFQNVLKAVPLANVFVPVL